MNFLRLDVFHFPGNMREERDRLRRELNAFIMAFHTGMAPAVGLQVTLTGEPAAAQEDRLELMVERAGLGECDLVAATREPAGERAWLWRNGVFVADARDEAPQALDVLLASRRGRPVTFLCVPPGDGQRWALDRDLDGSFDGDEVRLGRNPAQPEAASLSSRGRQ